MLGEGADLPSPEYPRLPNTAPPEAFSCPTAHVNLEVGGGGEPLLSREPKVVQKREGWHSNAAADPPLSSGESVLNPLAHPS